MKIIVTGSLGHVGLPLTKTLVGQGRQLTVISSNPEKQLYSGIKCRAGYQLGGRLDIFNGNVHRRGCRLNNGAPGQLLEPGAACNRTFQPDRGDNIIGITRTASQSSNCGCA